MIDKHSLLLPLQDDAVLWRYMSYEKFESLLNDSALFFCRCDKFPDPYEGSIPRREAEYRDSMVDARRWVESNGHQFDEEKERRNIEATKSLHERIRKATVANCWHINNSESDGMWKLYLKDNEGVAIQTTKANLDLVIANIPEKIYTSKVRYIDYETDVWYHPDEFPRDAYNMLTPLFHKRIEYAHESEYRLFYTLADAETDPDSFWAWQPDPKGVFIQVDVRQLVQGVFFSPTADSQVKVKIQSMAASAGYNFRYLDSRLSKPAYY